jgi:P27 family predicted phage terminase small subunit
MKGRPPKSNALKKLQGTDQPCRMRDELSVEPIKDPILKIPKGSPLKTKRARSIYKEKANQLIALRVLTPLDMEQLAMYSWLLDELFTCWEIVSEKGRFMERFDDIGNLIAYVPNPYYTQIKQLTELVNKIGGELGFSPVSRQKIKQEKEQSEDPFADLKKLL